MGPVAGVRLLMLMVVVSACNPEARPDQVIVGGRPDTLISANDPWLEEAVDLAVSESGLIYVLDRQASRVFRLDERGRPMSPLGREGSGPGEFRNPTTMGIGDEVVWVLDRGNGRLVGVSPNGSILGSHAIPAQPLIPTSHIDGEGNVLIATLGTHGTLARRFSRMTYPLGSPTHYRRGCGSAVECRASHPCGRPVEGGDRIAAPGFGRFVG
jgi:hypothetical protein